MLWLVVRRRWYRLLAAGSLLLLLSFAPSVIYLGHWSEFLGWTAPIEEEVPVEHVSHCHVGLVSCSVQPLPPDLSPTPAVVHVVEPELTSVALEQPEITTEEYVTAPPTEPPRG